MRRVLLFLALLTVGITILVILAEWQGGEVLHHESSHEVTKSLAPGAVAQQMQLTKVHATQRHTAGSGADAKTTVESEIWADEAVDQGNGYWMLKTVKIRLPNDKNPEANGLVLNAEQGLVALSGSFADMTIDSKKPVHFEGVVADFFDARGDLPPLRVRAPSLEGALEERRFWTEGPFALGQPEGEDFEGSGEGIEGDAKDGSVTMKKDPRIRYWVRPAPGAEVEREIRLRCDGPLKIGKSGEARLAQASGNAFLEIEEKKAKTTQTVRADSLHAWMRPGKPDGKKKAPIAFEKVEASGAVRIDAGQALLFGDRATASIDGSGHLSTLSVRGNPRAAFSSASAASLTQAAASENQSIFIQCEGPIEFGENPGSEGEMRMRFERNVLLFGAGPLAYLPSRFGEQLELQFERTPAPAEGGEGGFRILGGHADGDVAWRGGGATVFAPTMRMKRVGDDGMQITFSPAPFVETSFASAAFSQGKDAGPARTLSLFAENSLVQQSDPNNKNGGEITLDGRVWGRIPGNPGDPAGRLESNGLRVLTPRPGVTLLAAEHGFLYDEGGNGLFLQADRVEPFGEQGMRLLGAPAQLRQPGAGGKPLELSALSIAFDPITGEFRAQGNASATLQDSGNPLVLKSQVLEGARDEGGEGLRRLEAFQDVRLQSQGQEAGGESLHVDFAEKVHRIFGTDERPAWIAGPMDQGRFYAKSRRIEIRDGGDSVRLAPGATVEVRGKAIDFGALAPGSASNSTPGGVRILPQGESRIEKELITFSGGVRLESIDAPPADAWSLVCRELLLHRDPKTGELVKMEAREDVKYVSSDILASGTELHLWPKTNDMFLLGDERTPALLKLPSQEKPTRSTRIRYNFKTNLFDVGPGAAFPMR